MATDYDAPRRSDDADEDSVEELQSRRADKGTSVIDVDVDEPDHVDDFELPATDRSGLQLSVQVVPLQADEFTCSRCFLVHHRSQLTGQAGGQPVCSDCAS